MPLLTFEFSTIKGCTKMFEFEFVKEGTMIGSEGFSDDGGSLLTGAGADDNCLPPPLIGPFSTVNLGLLYHSNPK